MSRTHYSTLLYSFDTLDKTNSKSSFQISLLYFAQKLYSEETLTKSQLASTGMYYLIY